MNTWTPLVFVWYFFATQCRLNRWITVPNSTALIFAVDGYLHTQVIIATDHPAVVGNLVVPMQPDCSCYIAHAGHIALLTMWIYYGENLQKIYI